MKITMYELLGLVKDGKAPKKIEYEGLIWTFNKTFNQYQSRKGGGNIWDGYNFNILNETVEILEEEKKIPEKIGLILYCEDQATSLIHRKVDEIIDYLQYVKSKGE